VLTNQVIFYQQYYYINVFLLSKCLKRCYWWVLLCGTVADCDLLASYAASNYLSWQLLMPDTKRKFCELALDCALANMCCTAGCEVYTLVSWLYNQLCEFNMFDSCMVAPCGLGGVVE